MIQPGTMKGISPYIKKLFGLSLRRSSNTSDLDEVSKLIAAIRGAKLTYCGPPKLENIVEAHRIVSEDRVPGDLLEAGVALGGSAIIMAKLKKPGTKLWLYDVYGLIPPPGANDGEDSHRRFAEIAFGSSPGLGGEVYYGYRDNLYQTVRDNLKKFGINPDDGSIEMVKGLFQDTLLPSSPIALAHIDCDWFDSVKTCLHRITPYLSPGGIIVFDDYSSYSGCKEAVDLWLNEHPEMSVIFHQRSLGVRKAQAARA